MTEKKRVGYWLGLVFQRVWSGVRRRTLMAQHIGTQTTERMLGKTTATPLDQSAKRGVDLMEVICAV